MIRVSLLALFSFAVVCSGVGPLRPALGSDHVLIAQHRTDTTKPAGRPAPSAQKQDAHGSGNAAQRSVTCLCWRTVEGGKICDSINLQKCDCDPCGKRGDIVRY
jgi:hypothetical protein